MVAAIVIAVIVVILVVAFVSINNTIVRADNRCDNALQTLDAQLQRRFDLIPNLVETVKGYASHERETLEAVMAARNVGASAATPEARMAANEQLTGVLGRLFAVAENYPSLQANTNFLELQRELSDTENRISYARQSFNDCVLNYNNAIETFPGNIVAGLTSHGKREGFVVEDASIREAPQVKF